MRSTLVEEKLSYADLAHWTSEEYDADYRTFVSHYPQSAQASYLGESYFNDGKAFRSLLVYILRDSQLLIFSIKKGSSEFVWHRVFNLAEIAVQTEVSIGKPQSEWTLFPSRAVVYGEQFFFENSSPASSLDFPARGAFVLRAPDKRNIFYWQRFQVFARSLKVKIASINKSQRLLSDSSK